MAQTDVTTGGSLFDYLAERTASLADEPLGDVDATVLAYASYMYYDKGLLGRIAPDERVPLPMALCGVSRTDLFGPSTLMRIDGDTFLTAFLQSPRFMELEVGHYVEDLAPEQEKQFSAVTFYLPDGPAFVVVRGSDNSLAAWKEDFNLSFMEKVPSQLSARDYLDEAARMHAGSLYVIGHSKGGNLAEYAALTCSDETFARLTAAYSLDGPGFAYTPSPRINTKEYAAKLHKVIPESSVFGMMMEDRPIASLRMVQSSGVLFAQHVPSKWLVVDGDYVDAEQLTPDADIVAGTINSWSKTHGPEERQLFFDSIFDVLQQGNGVYWGDRTGLDSALDIMEAASQLPPEVRRAVVQMGLDIASTLGSEAARRALESATQRAGEIPSEG